MEATLSLSKCCFGGSVKENVEGGSGGSCEGWGFRHFPSQTQFEAAKQFEVVGENRLFLPVAQHQASELAGC